MCVRTALGAESREERRKQQHHQHQHQHQHQCQHGGVTASGNGLARAKEKCQLLCQETLGCESEQHLKDVESATMHPRVSRKLRHYLDGWQHSKLYKILFSTVQPAHLIVVAAVLCVFSALLPSSERITFPPVEHLHSKLTSFVYLASFIMHFGSQIWMTFVSGLSLYFALPRHTFGEVQRVLFPRYFTLNTCLSLITLLIYVKHHPANSWDTEIAIQVVGMSVAFFVELTIRLYLTPPLLKLIDLKTSLECAAGVGKEIGHQELRSLKYCPHYLKINKAFRRIHMIIAIGNMLTMGCTVFHLYYIASKLCVL